MNGTTGEGIYSLTDEERMDLLEAWMKQKHLIPTIIVQVSGTNLRSAQKMVYLFIYYYRYFQIIILSGQNPLIWPLHIPIIQVDTKSI